MRDKGVQKQAQNNVQALEVMVGEATRQAVRWFRLFASYYKALFLEESYANESLTAKINYAQDVYNARKSILVNVELDNAVIPKRYSFVLVPAIQVIDLNMVYNRHREFFNRLVIDYSIDSVKVFERKKVINFYSAGKWIYGLAFLVGNVFTGRDTSVAGFEETL